MAHLAQLAAVQFLDANIFGNNLFMNDDDDDDEMIDLYTTIKANKFVNANN